MDDIIIVPFSKEDEDLLYGERKNEIGTVYKNEDHMYLQRENDVLHVKSDGLINTLHVGFFNDPGKNLKLSTMKEFETLHTKVLSTLLI